MGVQVPLFYVDFDSFGYMPRSNVTGSCGSSFLNIFGGDGV
jgi:hypothetical protein